MRRPTGLSVGRIASETPHSALPTAFTLRANEGAAFRNARAWSSDVMALTIRPHRESRSTCTS